MLARDRDLVEHGRARQEAWHGGGASSEEWVRAEWEGRRGDWFFVVRKWKGVDDTPSHGRLMLLRRGGHDADGILLGTRKWMRTGMGK